MSDCKTQREVSLYYNYKDLINYRKKGLDMLSELDKPVVDDTIGINEKDLDDEDIESSGEYYQNSVSMLLWSLTGKPLHTPTFIYLYFHQSINQFILMCIWLLTYTIDIC